MTALLHRRRHRRRDELANAAQRILRHRENRLIARRDPQRLAYMIADEILNTQNTRRPSSRRVAALAPAVALAAAPLHHHPERHCERTFTLRMDERAAHAVYSGLRHVTRQNLRMLGYIERCQRRLHNWPVARQFNRRLDRAHKITLEQNRLSRTLSYATASWYEDAGSTASGFHATYGVAVCGSGGGPCVPFGTRILFDYHGRQVIATADDHGPYVAGRAFDLNQNTAQALGFGGVDTVGYRILR